MPPVTLAHVPEGVIVAYAFISIVFFTLAGLTFALARRFERRLILLGLLTVVASIGYATINVSPGVMIIPILTKLGVLLVLAGIVIRLLEGEARTDQPGVDDLTAAFNQATRSATSESRDSQQPEN